MHTYVDTSFFFFFFRYNLLTSPFGKRGFNVFLPLRPGNVAHSCNHSTQEARHENCKFETSLGYNSKTAQKKKSYPLTSSFSHNVPHSSFHHSSVGALVRLACSMLYYYIYIRLFWITAFVMNFCFPFVARTFGFS